MEYYVSFYMDNIYEVYSIGGETLFRGSLADCEAWIRLKEEGRI